MKIHNLYLSTPHQILEDKISNSDIKYMKEVISKNIEKSKIRFKSKILDNIISIEKQFNIIKIIKSKEINHSNILSTL